MTLYHRRLGQIGYSGKPMAAPYQPLMGFR